MKPYDYSVKIYNLLGELVELLNNENVEFATQDDIDDATDNLYDCPFQNIIGKYDYSTTYYIFKIQDGTAYGVELEDDKIEEFKISELDNDCVLQIASRID